MPEPSLPERLKQRKIVQWAIAYLAGAWVLVEATGHVVEQFGFPIAVSQAVTVLAFFGFFIVLVIAWYHGEKGRQWVSGPELLIIALLLLISGGVLSTLRNRERSTKPPQAAPLPENQGDRRSIAVLPFEDHSPDPDDAYFAEGMHGEVISKLSSISGLRVIPRASMTQYKENPGVARLAADLGTEFVLDGTARMAGGLVRLTVQLIDVRSGEQLWSENFDREYAVEHLIQVQSEIAQRVALEIGAEVAPEEMRRISETPTASTEAYEAYQHGRYYMSVYGESNFRRAIQFFELGLEADSLFALAHSGLAEAYAWLAMANIEGPETTWPFVRESAHRALELDESLPTAHAVAALETMYYQYNWAGAEAGFKRSLSLNPDQEDALLYYSWLLAVLDREDEAVSHANEARALAPKSPWVEMMYCWTLLFVGRYDEARIIAETMVQSEPPNPVGNVLLAQILFEEGQYEASLAPLRAWMISQGEDVAEEEGFSAMIYGLIGQPEEAQRHAEQMEEYAAEGRWVSPGNRAWVAIGQGDLDRAFRLLEEGLQIRDNLMIFVALDFMFPVVCDDPRFEELLQRMGLG